jgi:hypothetical protein
MVSAPHISEPSGATISYIDRIFIYRMKSGTITMAVITTTASTRPSRMVFVEPKARCTATAIPNQASEERGRCRDWMASIPLHRMKVLPDSQRKLSQIA